jgi:hypothetical protein
MQTSYSYFDLALDHPPTAACSVALVALVESADYSLVLVVRIES